MTPDRSQSIDTVPSESAARAAGGFKFIIAFAALFIAGCSAYFSVNGMGLLFIGSAGAVMVMAASLEVGKLVAASFLYRHWQDLRWSLRFYLTAAVILLIGITSLGNYGYLARAYEKTNSQVSAYEQQIGAAQREIDEVKAQIDLSRASAGKVSNDGRQDLDKIRQTIAQANGELDASLARLEVRRKTAKDKRDHDADLMNARMREQAGVLQQGLDSEHGAITNLTDRIAALDRAVEMYTSEGTGGFFKQDGVQRGQELRQKQKLEREAISADLARHQASEEKLRTQHAAAVQSVSTDMAAVDAQYKKDLEGFSANESTLRADRNTAVASAEKQLAAMQSQDKNSLQQGDNQIEGLYARIQADNDTIDRLKGQVAATDIGSYRFVARAFNAPADDVVKWLILVVVLVFDPLAVTLTIGFNIVAMGDRRGRAVPVNRTAQRTDSPRLRWLRPAAVAMVGLLVLGGLVGATYALRGWIPASTASASVLVPADSFAVLTVRPGELQQYIANPQLSAMFGKSGADSMNGVLRELLASGLDQSGEWYAFVKYPHARLAAGSDRPVMICGLVARVGDSSTVETGLAQLSQSLTQKLAPPAKDDPKQPQRPRSMVHFGSGRYLDPQGGFLTFAITQNTAVVLLEIDGDPNHPCLEQEVRLCLAPPDATQSAGTALAEQKLPARALGAPGGPMALWFDARRCFADMPKNSQALARFQELQRFVGFDLKLSARAAAPGQLQIVGDYVYSAARFGAAPSAKDATAVQVLTRIGSSDSAGVAGKLMDRCAISLDFEGLIDQLNDVFNRHAAGESPATVLVEKTINDDRAGQFVMTAHLPEPPSPVTARPATATPATAEPATASPVKSVPVSAASATVSPVTAMPGGAASVTATPVTATPVKSTPVTAAPGTATPVTAAPASASLDVSAR